MHNHDYQTQARCICEEVQMRVRCVLQKCAHLTFQSFQLPQSAHRICTAGVCTHVQQCNTENFYSSAPHCKILRVVNKGLSNHPAVFIHWIHTNAVDTMACLRHSTPRNTNRMWMADIKYFTRKLEASNIWLNSTLSSFDSSVSGGYLFNPLLVLSWNIWNKCRHQPMQVTANHFSTCLQNSFFNEWRDTRRSIIQGIVLEGNFAVAAQCCSGSNILLKLNLG